MAPRLKSILIEDFRSIRGKHTMSLDAPVVLIHGSNGAGKTSVLSAIELALTGAVSSLCRAEPGYVEFLPNKSAKDGHGRVAIEVGGLESFSRAEVVVTRDSIGKANHLPTDMARFFSERCYLAQSTLGRLLEIYQHQDTRKTDTPLTRFVKDLLGLDQLDALIDGLYTSGDVRRLREPVPVYGSVREEVPTLEAELARVGGELLALEQETKATESEVLGRLPALLPETTSDPIELGGIAARLRERDEAPALLSLARLRREIISASEQLASVTAAAAAANRQAVEQEEAASRALLERWRTSVGASLENIVSELQPSFPNLRTLSPDGPQALRTAAAKAVNEQLVRLTEVVGRDDAGTRQIAELEQSVLQGDARAKILDTQITERVGVNEGLAQALSALVPHIHEQGCPVCGRDYSEVSLSPLASRVSEQIASLVEAAGRLQAMVRDKAATLSAVNQAKRELGELVARRLSPAQRDEYKVRRARLAELSARLASLEEGAAEGVLLEQRAATAISHLSALRSQDMVAASMRETVARFAAQLSQPPPDEAESVLSGLSRLRSVLDEKERALVALQTLRRATLESVVALDVLRRRREAHDADIRRKSRRLGQLKQAKGEADRCLELAKDLLKRAREARASVIRRVFNDELNLLWRDLFVRLAPEEQFVPAFVLPASTTGAVEAALETQYAAGGRGGNPRAMLSAGNLNTAALTLFLALHLSVKPSLPWLLIDDPVQSMDEVHVAQFAALLRTLAKKHDRQIILAVHERSLFEYLALELSPAYLDDRLITIELGRAADGLTTAPWETTIYEPDRAVAV